MSSHKYVAIVVGMSDTWPDEITAPIAAEIRRLRGERSGQWLSDRTHDLGHRVSRSKISEIETRRRKSITVADLIILAAALDTVPIALIYPGPYDEAVRALPKLDVPQIWAVRWFSGELRTTSEVSFDETGHYVKLAHPQAYAANIRRLENARRAVQLDDRKTAMWRELNRMRHLKETGEQVSDDEIRGVTEIIAELQDQINHYLAPEDSAQERFEKFVSDTWPNSRRAESDGR